MIRIGWFTNQRINPSGTAARVRCRSHLDEVCALGFGENQVLAVRSPRDEVGTFGSNGNEVRAVGSDLMEVGTARRRSGRGRGDLEGAELRVRRGPGGWISGGEVQWSGSDAGLRSVEETSRGGGLDHRSMTRGGLDRPIRTKGDLGARDFEGRRESAVRIH